MGTIQEQKIDYSLDGEVFFKCIRDAYQSSKQKSISREKKYSEDETSKIADEILIEIKKRIELYKEIGEIDFSIAYYPFENVEDFEELIEEISGKLRQRLPGFKIEEINDCQLNINWQ